MPSTLPPFETILQFLSKLVLIHYKKTLEKRTIVYHFEILLKAWTLHVSSPIKIQALADV
jgi:hypothetical protein